MLNDAYQQRLGYHLVKYNGISIACVAAIFITSHSDKAIWAAMPQRGEELHGMSCLRCV